MKEPEMRQIAVWITKALEQRNDDAFLERIRARWPNWPTGSRCMPGGARRQP